MLNSSRDVGVEVYQFISDMVGLDIYILLVTSDDIYHITNTVKGPNERNTIVIAGNGFHYEVIGLDNGQYFQTVFSPAEPFIQAIKVLIGT